MIENSEVQYLNIIKRILSGGVKTPNRTGIDALTVPHVMIQHDMAEGFPLLTTKKMAWKVMKVELEGFIKGINSKRWFQERGCHIWDEWATPSKIAKNLSDEDRKKAQLAEDDLGPIYGVQWRSFNGIKDDSADQLKTIVNTLKKDPNNRRMVCSAFNPLQLDQMALPPCHLLWNLTVINYTVNLCFFMRSVDVGLGLPFNLSSYSLLLHLLAKEANLKEGIVTGFLSNVHIYENQIDGLKEQIKRSPYPYPKIETQHFTTIFDWQYSDTKLIDYKSHEKISLPIAV